MKSLWKLKEKPRTFGKVLVGINLWVLRVGDYRILYEIIEKDRKGGYSLLAIEKIFIEKYKHKRRIRQGLAKRLKGCMGSIPTKARIETPQALFLHLYLCLYVAKNSRRERIETEYSI